MSEPQNRFVAGVLKETFLNERRVAVVPALIAGLNKAGVDLLIEAGAGQEAGYVDEEYRAKGATVTGRDEIIEKSAVFLSVRALGADPDGWRTLLDRMKPNQTLIGAIEPFSDIETLKAAAGKGISVFALELIPRITRAQSMDILSSMASIAGYKAVLLAASALPKMFPMMMTAAGTIAASHVFVIGAGVAGLQAIATAKRLGAVVEAYDVRPAVKDQIHSLGAKFVEFDLETTQSEDKGGYAKAQDEEFYRKQREMMGKVIAANDVVITTAAIPGKKAPILVTEEMVKGMQPGSVIVDLAAERGGNCELTKPGETVEAYGVSIIGPANLPSTVPFHSSQVYAKNITTFLLNMVEKGVLDPEKDDQIVKDTLVVHNGEIVHPFVREVHGLPALPKQEVAAE